MTFPTVRVQTYVCIAVLFSTLITTTHAQVLNLQQAGVIENGVGAVPNLTGAWACAVQGNYLYTVGNGDALEITDITIPGLPQDKGRIVNGEGGARIISPRGLFVSGNYAYVSNFDGSSVEIVDVSDPAHPKHKGVILHEGRVPPTQTFLNRPHGIFVLGKYAYVAVNGDGGGLEIIDVSNPAQPVHKSKITSGGAAAFNEAVGIHVASIKNKLYAFVAVSFPGTQGVNIVDVTNPAAPTFVRMILHASLASPTGVYVSGTSLFVASAGSSTITKWRVTDPATTAPTLQATLSNPGGSGNTSGYLYRPWNVVVSGKYVYSWAEVGSIVAADTTNLTVGPQAFFTHSSMAASLTPAHVIAVQGNYVYTAANNLVIVEAADPANIRPFIKATLSTGSGGANMAAPFGVFWYRDHLYVANSHGFLEILDATDPTELKHVSSIAVGDFMEGPRNVYVFANYAYLVTLDGLEIVDVSNPASPVHKSRLNNGAGGTAPYLTDPNQVVVAKGTFDANTYAYIASTGSNALEIVNVTNPSAPVHHASIANGQGGATLAGPTHLFVRNEYAYVLASGTHAVHGGARGALEIVNVAFPNVPAHTSTVGSVGSAAFDPFGMSKGGNNITVAPSGTSLFAYIVDPSRKAFQVVNVTAPASPTLAGTLLNNVALNNIEWTRGVALSGNYALVANRFGLEAINITNPTTPTHHSFFQTGNGGSLLDNTTSIFVSDKYAYLGNIGNTSNINVVDIYAPGIANFNPKTGPPGTPVVIDGVNFNTFVTASIDGLTVPITTVANNVLNVTIPQGANIARLTLSINNQKVTTATNFVVTPTTIPTTNITQAGFTANWTNVAAANYFIDISTTGFTSFVTGYNNRLVNNVTSFAPNDLAPGTTYQYRVRSNDGTTNSASSAPVTVQTIPATPTANAATVIGQNSLTISWNAITSATNYYVDVAIDNGFNTILGNYNNLSVSGTSLAVNALSAGTSYFYRVRAANVSGSSPSSATMSAITLPTSPTATPAQAITTTGFTANWDAVPGADGYRIDVSTDNFATFVTGLENVLVGTNISYNAAVNSGTSYQYRVRAFNASGISPNSNIISVLTLTPKPGAQPTGLIFTNVESTSVTVSYTAAVGNPGGYLVLRSTSDALTAAPVNGASYQVRTVIGNAEVAYVGPALSFFDGGLPTSLRYYYWVYSFNGTGLSSNHLTDNPLKGNVILDSEAPVISPAAVPNPLTITSGNTPIFNSKITDKGGIATAQINYKGISKRDFKSAPMSFTSNDNYSVQIQTDWYDSLGLEYYFSAVDQAGNASPKPLSSFVQLVNTSMSLPVLPSGPDKADYRIVSFPFQLTGGNSVASVYANVPWSNDTQSGLWWWNPQNNGGAYDKFGREISLQTIDPGKGYWIITRSPVTPQLSNVPAPRYNRSNLFQMTLKPGWNQIGNPYPIPISWNNVIDFNQATNPTASFGKLTVYDGTALKEGNQLKAYEGGFVKSFSTTDITILIPFPNQDEIGGRTHDVTPDAREDDWRIFMHISQGELENRLGGFGMNPSASTSEDAFDAFSPPMLIDVPGVLFTHPGRKAMLAGDVVGTQDEFTWSFFPSGNIGMPLKIAWSNDITLPAGKQLLLFDEENLTLIDMTAEQSYSFDPSKNKRFRIFYGRDLEGKIFSEDIAASAPFPNPVDYTGHASLKLSLPAGSEYTVTVKVYSLQGVQITSVNRTFGKGLHQFDIDLSDENLSPGVYLYKVQVLSSKSERMLTGKIVKP